MSLLSTAYQVVRQYIAHATMGLVLLADRSSSVASAPVLRFYSSAPPTDAEANGSFGLTPTGLYHRVGSAWVLVATNGASIDLNGLELILDADADTSLTADTDDQIDVKISGADDFRFTANTFTALSGSSIATNTLTETTAGSGITADGGLLKDGGFTLGAAGVLSFNGDVTFTHSSGDVHISNGGGAGLLLGLADTFRFADEADTTKRVAIAANGITTGTTRTVTVPDANVTIGTVRGATKFASTEQTGTGAPQNVAHGLGATPGLVWFTVTEDPAGTGFDIAEGAHDGTNLVVTVTTGVKFMAYALLTT